MLDKEEKEEEEDEEEEEEEEEEETEGEQEEFSPSPIARRTRSRGKKGGADQGEEEGWEEEKEEKKEESNEETKADYVEDANEFDDDPMSFDAVNHGLQRESRYLDSRFDGIPHHRISSRFDGLSGPELDKEILRARRERLASIRRVYGVIPDSFQQQDHPPIGDYRLRTLADITHKFGQKGKISQYIQAQKAVEQAVDEMDSMPRARKTDKDLIALLESMRGNTSDQESKEYEQFEEKRAARLLRQKIYDEAKLHWYNVEKPALEMRNRLREEEEVKRLYDIEPQITAAFDLPLDGLTLNDVQAQASPGSQPVAPEEDQLTEDDGTVEEDEN